MKKLVLAIGLCLIGTAIQAQDIIITKSGEEIRAIINEVTGSEVRYRAYANPNGAEFALPRQDVFTILIKSENTPKPQQPVQAYTQQPQQTYAPQQQQTYTPPPVQSYTQQPQQTYVQPTNRKPETDGQAYDFNPGRFGLDWGIGGANFGEGSDSFFGLTFGMHYTRMFIPYVGWNIFDIRTTLIKNGSVNELNDQLRFGSLEFMTGLRGVYPLLIKGDQAILSPFVAFKMGYGVFLNYPEYYIPGGFAMDLEIGVEFLSSSYVAFGYNFHKLSKDLKEGDKMDGKVNGFTFRIGYQF